MITIKSVNKTYLGSSAPKPKNPNFFAYNVEDIQTYPTRDSKGIKSVGDLILKPGKKGIGIYVTPSTISRPDTQNGDYPARGFISTVLGTVPGDELALNELVQYFVNKDWIIITEGCESDADTRMHGSKCAPMELSSEETDNNEGTSKAFTFTQTARYKYKSMHYSGAIPEIEEYATQEEPDGA